MHDGIGVRSCAQAVGLLGADSRWGFNCGSLVRDDDAVVGYVKMVKVIVHFEAWWDFWAWLFIKKKNEDELQNAPWLKDLRSFIHSFTHSLPSLTH
ncbi:hypothetical protein RIF29_39378 [Crotalaria pallida]|uniref:Uncharacterized protein n=1 Tax=Crotalaria pallida TaxID=3830 RepID=A0AAN9E1L3_CROPI